MTDEEMEEQAVSFAYGNLKASGRGITRDEVREAYRRLKAKRETDC